MTPYQEPYYFQGNPDASVVQTLHLAYLLRFRANLSPELIYKDGKVFGLYEWRVSNPAAELDRWLARTKLPPVRAGNHKAPVEMRVERRVEPDWDKLCEVMVKMAMEEMDEERRVSDGLD